MTVPKRYPAPHRAQSAERALLSATESGCAFARHETFGPRSGWLPKGFDAASRDNGIFLRDDAPTVLGVGKNMARAIRYWTHAFGLLEDVPADRARVFASRPTEIGQFLMGRSGRDPYLEDAGTLWYLHWRLVRVPQLATSWYFAFGVFPEIEFTQDQLEASLRTFVRQTYPAARAVDASLHKDVLCLLRMYGDSPLTGPLTEESIQCPFASLGLIRSTGETKSFAFDLGEKPDLPANVIVAACLEFAAAQQQAGRTIALSRLLYDPGSPGLAFKLTESTLSAAVDEVAGRHRALSLSDTAGLVQMAYREDPLELARDLLASYYSTATLVGGRA
ncbi:MAG: DUF4007 family protein [Gemmatimonas sp.]|uniref:DUF4007 family protein n=1 Tax=Gemmatimonas sp. TaxID=1962908 RepID=UPI00391DC1B0